MKLNNKGYMLVEIILASVIAMSIAYYLLNLTYRFKNKNEDVYSSTTLIADRIIITKNIMNDLEDKNVRIDTIDGNGTYVELTVNDVKKRIMVTDHTITYGTWKDDKFVTDDTSYYTKKLPSNIELGKITYEDNLTITIAMNDIYSENKSDIKLFIEDSYVVRKTYKYTGSYQIFTATEDAWYKIEAWGAQGGSSLLQATGSIAVDVSDRTTTCIKDKYNKCAGGKGGYTSGIIHLNKGEKLYIYVGGKGEDGKYEEETSTSIGGEGGYNGGGAGTGDGADDESDGGGGGATDIRYFTTPPSEEDDVLEWDSEIGLASRIMVAGGGGGASDAFSGLPGGGLVTSNTNAAGFSRTGFVPAGQIGSYKVEEQFDSFGKGQNGEIGQNNNGDIVDGRVNYPVAGGGGGYYGGIAYDNGATSNWANPGGGGSSFISGYAGSNAVQLGTKTITLENEDGTTTPKTYQGIDKHKNDPLHYSGKYFVNGVMKIGEKNGNGMVKITTVSEPTKINVNLKNIRYIRDCTDGNTRNNQNHWREIQAISGEGTNVAHNKNIISATVNSSPAVAYNEKTVFTYITDGLMDYGDGTYGYGATAGTGYSCVTVDLGGIYDLNDIVVWHYFSDNRYYKKNKIEISKDKSTWTTILNDTNKEVYETPQGKRISAYQ